jgi:hypothetical protein
VPLQIPTSCMQCQVESGFPDLFSLGTSPIPDDGIIEVTCRFGHETRLILQNERFELLSELAVIAIADGYPREAVASFAAALERLFEFYVRVVCRELRIDQVAIDDVWKYLRNSSERQLGAYSQTFLLTEGVAAPLLGQRESEFRNKVVHKGYFPTEGEAIAFGQSVADLVVQITRSFKTEARNLALRDLSFAKAVPAHKDSWAGGKRPSTCYMPTAFSIGNVDSIDVAKIVAERAGRPKLAELLKPEAILKALLGEAGK